MRWSIGLRRVARPVGLVVVLVISGVACGVPAQRAKPPRPGPSAAAPNDKVDRTRAVAAGEFHRSGYRPQPVDDAHLPYSSHGTLIRLPDPLPHDRTGVRMYRVGNRLVDHPLGQAQYGLLLLATYRHTRDPIFLELALKQARRIVARRTVVNTAWFYPYRFDFAMHDDPALLQRAPWYSGMSQALALSLFSRLAVDTGDSRWQQAAFATFDSLLVPPSDRTPWVTHVDSSGYLWIDEYPERPAPRSDLTYNGHIFGVSGLFDFVHDLAASSGARLPIALRLLDGAETTSRQYAPAIRSRGWVSKYCLQDGARAAGYHVIHTGQLAQLYTYTHDGMFATYAENFRRDYPARTSSGTIGLRPGVYQVARFDPTTGRTLRTQELTVWAPSSLPARARERIRGHGIYLNIGAGRFMTWWIRETPGHVWLHGVTARVDFYPWRPVTVDGATTAYRLDGRGDPVSARTVAHTTVLSDETADVNGRESWHVAAGPLAGSWLTASVPATGS